MKNKDPKHLEDIKRLQKIAGSRESKKFKTPIKGDPIEMMAKEANKSPRKMFKESMAQFNKLYDKKS